MELATALLNGIDLNYDALTIKREGGDTTIKERIYCIIFQFADNSTTQ